MSSAVYQALIRTHHITSRKKVASLKAAAKKLSVQALLRSGGVPGVMFVQGSDRQAVQAWVDTVHELRYKDYQLVEPVSIQESAISTTTDPGSIHESAGSLHEVETVKEMSAMMEKKGLIEWWRAGMGFVAK